MVARCPKCEAPLTSANIDNLPLEDRGGGRTWHGAVITCPRCSSILGVSIDPLKIQRTIIEEVRKS